MVLDGLRLVKMVYQAGPGWTSWSGWSGRFDSVVNKVVIKLVSAGLWWSAPSWQTDQLRQAGGWSFSDQKHSTSQLTSISWCLLGRWIDIIIIKSRFMDVEKGDTRVVGETEEEAEDRMRWRQMISYVDSTGTKNIYE